VSLPLMDMLSTMLKRLKQGKKIMAADRSHVHHILIDMGLSPRQTLYLLAFWGTVCILCGLALESIPAYLSLLCYFLVFSAHCLFVMYSETVALALGLLKNERVAPKNLQENA
jgi:UDP-GlcNAc:undecaprenyl-phosphate GlcNAc-1-phosphate transferase